jgi:mitochondrial fission protein ELM1
MMSDALSTGTPAYRLRMKGGSDKFLRLYQNLKRRCMFKEFDGELKSYNYKPLKDAQKIADEIKKRIAEQASSH